MPTTSEEFAASPFPQVVSLCVVRTSMISHLQGDSISPRSGTALTSRSGQGDLKMIDPKPPVLRAMASDSAGPMPTESGLVVSPTPEAIRRPTLAVMRTVACLTLLILLLSVFACGGDSPGSDSAFNYVLAYETQIVVFDMAAMSEDIAPGSLADMYAEMSTFGMLGVQPKEIDTLVMAENSGAGSDFAVFEGDLSFGNVRNVLHNNLLREDTFRGVEIWEDLAAQWGAAIFEDAGVFIIGDNPKVKEVIRAIEDGYGSIANADDSPIRRVLDGAGRGWILVAYADGEGPCWGIGCEAWASAIADGEEEYDVKQTIVPRSTT